MIAHQPASILMCMGMKQAILPDGWIYRGVACESLFGLWMDGPESGQIDMDAWMWAMMA